MIKKNIITICLLFIIFICFTGCQASDDGSDTASKDEKISTDFIKIDGEENFYYAKNTKIVYWIGGSYVVNVTGNDFTTSYMTVWYSENGKICKYKDGKIIEMR